MKRYFVFAWEEQNYGSGGMEDYQNAFDCLEEANRYAKKIHKKGKVFKNSTIGGYVQHTTGFFDCIQIWDMEKLEKIKTIERN